MPLTSDGDVAEGAREHESIPHSSINAAAKPPATEAKPVRSINGVLGIVYKSERIHIDRGNAALQLLPRSRGMGTTYRGLLGSVETNFYAFGSFLRAAHHAALFYKFSDHSIFSMESNPRRIASLLHFREEGLTAKIARYLYVFEE